jgi:hypothetical protein
MVAQPEAMGFIVTISLPVYLPAWSRHRRARFRFRQHHCSSTYSWYLATIRLPGGSECTVSFQAGRGYGILGGVCK